MQIIMCPPTHFDVKYQINPWMDNQSPVDKRLAKKQWQNLHDLYKKLNIQVHLVEPNPDFPDMVFATDSFIIHKNKVLLANFYYSERVEESQLFQDLLKSLNLEIITLPKKYKFEGGDFKFLDNQLFLGVNFRTQQNSANPISKLFNIPVIPLELVNKYFYHLDTCLFILDSDHAFYIKNAFSQNSQKILQDHFKNLYEIDGHDANLFATNSVIFGKSIICNSGTNGFKNTLQNLNYQIHEIEMSEFIKSGGAIHCLSNIMI